VFAFEESTSTITNRVRLEVWQDDLPAAATNTAVDGSTHAPIAVSSNGSTGKSQGSSSSSSSSSRRALVPSSRRGLTGIKAHNKLRYSSSFKSSGGSSAGSSSSKGSGGSSVTSYQLSDVEPESDSADSHMLVDVELEDEDSLTGSSWGSTAGSNGSSGGSSGSSGGSITSGSASLGSTFIELDQLTEALVQVGGQDTVSALHTGIGAQLKNHVQHKVIQQHLWHGHKRHGVPG